MSNTAPSVPANVPSTSAGPLPPGSPTDEATLKPGQIDPENYLKRPDEFEHDFLELYMHDPFLGGCSMAVTKFADPKCPTAYIGVRTNGARHEVIMGYSPKFMRGLSREERKGVIRHELYHLIFQHIFHRSVSDSADQKLWNWATDLAINSLIGAEHLPRMCLIPGHAPTDPATGKAIEGPYATYIKSAKTMQASDHYFDELKKIRDENGENTPDFNLIDSMDGHDGWGNIDPEILEELRDKVRDMVEGATKNADRNNSWGSVPMAIQEMIRKMLSREVDWKSIIRNFIGRSRTLERTSTIKRVNKKLPYIQPGCKRPFRANFACFMDQSGSMGDDDIALLFGELSGLANLTTLDVYHFDTEVDEASHKVWKKGNANPDRLRTRGGGTDFDAVAAFCNGTANRGKWSGVIILTDGYAPKMGMINGARVLWVVTPGGTMEHIRPGDLACQMKRDSGKFKSY